MRLWQFRIVQKVSFFSGKPRTTRSEYMEIDLPTHRDAYRFALDWFMDDPSMLSIRVTDPAGRREPFVLDRKGGR